MNRIAPLLPARNVLLDVQATSKKRLFEQAALLFENEHGIERGFEKRVKKYLNLLRGKRWKPVSTRCKSAPAV